MQSGLGIIHLAFPAFHLHYVEITLFPILQHLLAIEHQCQLTASEGVKVRNFKLAYKRNAIIFNQVAFNLQSAYGIGPSSTMNSLPFSAAASMASPMVLM